MKALLVVGGVAFVLASSLLAGFTGACISYFILTSSRSWMAIDEAMSFPLDFDYNAVRHHPPERDKVEPTAAVAVVDIQGTGWVKARHWKPELVHWNPLRFVRWLPGFPGSLEPPALADLTMMFDYNGLESHSPMLLDVSIRYAGEKRHAAACETPAESCENNILPRTPHTPHTAPGASPPYRSFLGGPPFSDGLEGYGLQAPRVISQPFAPTNDASEYQRSVCARLRRLVHSAVLLLPVQTLMDYLIDLGWCRRQVRGEVKLMRFVEARKVRAVSLKLHRYDLACEPAGPAKKPECHEHHLLALTNAALVFTDIQLPWFFQRHSLASCICVGLLVGFLNMLCWAKVVAWAISQID